MNDRILVDLVLISLIRVLINRKQYQNKFNCFEDLKLTFGIHDLFHRTTSSSVSKMKLNYPTNAKIFRWKGISRFINCEKIL